jgi:hypothetical protein
MLEFNEERHEYKYDGQIIPSVTQIIKDAGLSGIEGIPENRLLVAGLLGTAVHDACWYDDDGQLDPASIDAEVLPYLVQWRKFKADFSFLASKKEELLYHKKYRYAGRIDRIGEMMLSSTPRSAIVDIKTGSKQRSHAIQLTAYKELAKENGVLPAKKQTACVAVYLSKESYNVKEYSVTTEFNVFLSALNIYNWKKG